MNDADTDSTDVDKWDRGLTEHVVALTRPIVKKYFRSEVRGLDNIPAGPSLVVANHSGGLMTFDLSVFAVDYYDTYGYDRPLYALGFDTVFAGPAADFFRRTGVIRATRDNAAKALAAGGVVLVFPAGTTTCTGPPCKKTSSISMAEPGTSPRHWRQTFPSFPPSPWAARKASCS